MHIVCVIPARYSSQRLPGKPLQLLKGRPMIEWAARNAVAMKLFDEVLVATDDERIADAVKPAGVEAVMTDPELPSGTDRIRAAIEGRPGDIIVNLQGDEPAMPRVTVQLALDALRHTGAHAATACVPITDRALFEAPHVVKVVRGADDRALYFSRAPIPALARRDAEELATSGGILGYKHLGLYIYTREALTRFCELPTSFLERVEKLEQLRLLEAGMSLVCVTTPADSVGVDVPEDVARAEAHLSQPAPES